VTLANPAVTVARSLSDTFAGIRPADAPAFVAAAQCVGAILATSLIGWLVRPATEPRPREVAITRQAAE
jgi:glycerol uptake facilitator-like aquaporin